MRTKQKTKWTADETVVAITALATHDDLVCRGERRRGDDRLVRAHPAYFVRDGATTEEMHEALLRLETVEVPQHPIEFTRPARPTVSIDEARICTVRFMVISSGVTVERGTILHRDDRLVRAHPDRFVVLTVPDPEA